METAAFEIFFGTRGAAPTRAAELAGKLLSLRDAERNTGPARRGSFWATSLAGPTAEDPPLQYPTHLLSLSSTDGCAPAMASAGAAPETLADAVAALGPGVTHRRPIHGQYRPVVRPAGVRASRVPRTVSGENAGRHTESAPPERRRDSARELKLTTRARPRANNFFIGGACRSRSVQHVSATSERPGSPGPVHKL